MMICEGSDIRYQQKTHRHRFHYVMKTRRYLRENRQKGFISLYYRKVWHYYFNTKTQKNSI